MFSEEESMILLIFLDLLALKSYFPLLFITCNILIFKILTFLYDQT